MLLFVAILLIAINNAIILLVLIVIMFTETEWRLRGHRPGNPCTDRSRVTLAHHDCSFIIETCSLVTQRISSGF